MNNYDWADTFREVYDAGYEVYMSGHKYLEEMFTDEQVEFLRSIGTTPREIFDFVEDNILSGGEPSFETVLLITSARRDYFFSQQRGRWTNKLVSIDDLPAKTDELDGIPWLPRLIAKARAKLRGEMPDELMYGCGGDRPFCEQHNLHPADFLRVVWMAGDNDDLILQYVKSQSDEF
ncbi:MAG: DUF5069 domain-containing protein [Verrucomicrobia bacterium]|nr:DUF5069 domain-containing protein [Verrucomicrobiota bacterium]